MTDTAQLRKLAAAVSNTTGCVGHNGHVALYRAGTNPEVIIELLDTIERLTAERDALAKGRTELNALLFAIDTQAGNGMIPWPIEDAYAEYEKAIKDQP